uniref:Opsin 6, group member a n=1 Tax=Cyprinus carpio TaxID=7962 RepID=A0A8C2GLC8_CYPCA
MSVQTPLQVVNIPWRNNNFSLLSRDPPLSDQGETIIGVYLLVLGQSALRLLSSVSSHRELSSVVDGFFTLVFGLGSINTLTVISISRYIKGCHPNKAHCITNTTVLTSVIFIWTGALFWSGAPILGWGSYTGQCVKGLTVRFLLLSLLCYITVRQIEADPRRVSIVICTAFILAWSPYAVVSMWSACGFHVPSLTSIFTRLFAKSASFYNPLIYFGLSSKFRRDVSVLLPCGGEARDAVKLKRFKKIQRFRAEEHRQLHKNQKKHPPANPAPGPAPGVCSHLETPPPAGTQVFFIDAPEPPDTPESQCVRL